MFASVVVVRDGYMRPDTIAFDGPGRRIGAGEKRFGGAAPGALPAAPEGSDGRGGGAAATAAEEQDSEGAEEKEGESAAASAVDGSSLAYARGNSEQDKAREVMDAEAAKAAAAKDSGVVIETKGPRKGLPAAPEAGDDGEGGWIDAYEEVLRAVLKDMKVFSKGIKLRVGAAGVREGTEWQQRSHDNPTQADALLKGFTPPSDEERFLKSLEDRKAVQALGEDAALMTMVEARKKAAAATGEDRPGSFKYVMITVFRDCHRFFLSAYEPATSLLRFTATRNDLEHVNDLLAPSTAEAKDPRPRPLQAKEVFKRLTELVSFRRDRVSGRLLISLDRPRIRLFRVSRQLDSHFITLTAYEELARVVSFDAFLHKLKTTVSLRVPESTTIALGLATPSTEEREDLQSGAIRRIAWALSNRLTLRTLRGATVPVLGLRRTGDGGQVVASATVRLCGEIRIVRLYDTGQYLTVSVYTPSYSTTDRFVLGPFQRQLLLGTPSSSRRRDVLRAVLGRLRAIPRGHCMPLMTRPSGSAEGSGSGSSAEAFTGRPLLPRPSEGAKSLQLANTRVRGGADKKHRVFARVAVPTPTILELRRSIVSTVTRVSTDMLWVTAEAASESMELVLEAFVPGRCRSYRLSVPVDAVQAALDEGWEAALAAEAAHRSRQEHLRVVRVMEDTEAATLAAAGDGDKLKRDIEAGLLKPPVAPMSRGGLDTWSDYKDDRAEELKADSSVKIKGREARRRAVVAAARMLRSSTVAVAGHCPEWPPRSLEEMRKAVRLVCTRLRWLHGMNEATKEVGEAARLKLQRRDMLSAAEGKRSKKQQQELEALRLTAEEERAVQHLDMVEAEAKAVKEHTESNKAEEMARWRTDLPDEKEVYACAKAKPRLRNEGEALVKWTLIPMAGRDREALLATLNADGTDVLETPSGIYLRSPVPPAASLAPYFSNLRRAARALARNRETLVAAKRAVGRARGRVVQFMEGIPTPRLALGSASCAPSIPPTLSAAAEMAVHDANIAAADFQEALRQFAAAKEAATQAVMKEADAQALREEEEEGAEGAAPQKEALRGAVGSMDSGWEPSYDAEGEEKAGEDERPVSAAAMKQREKDEKEEEEEEEGVEHKAETEEDEAGEGAHRGILGEEGTPEDVEEALIRSAENADDGVVIRQLSGGVEGLGNSLLGVKEGKVLVRKAMRMPVLPWDSFGNLPREWAGGIGVPIGTAVGYAVPKDIQTEALNATAVLLNRPLPEAEEESKQRSDAEEPSRWTVMSVKELLVPHSGAEVVGLRITGYDPETSATASADVSLERQEIRRVVAEEGLLLPSSRKRLAMHLLEHCVSRAPPDASHLFHPLLKALMADYSAFLAAQAAHEGGSDATGAGAAKVPAVIAAPGRSAPGVAGHGVGDSARNAALQGSTAQGHVSGEVGGNAVAGVIVSPAVEHRARLLAQQLRPNAFSLVVRRGPLPTVNKVTPLPGTAATAGKTAVAEILEATVNAADTAATKALEAVKAAGSPTALADDGRPLLIAAASGEAKRAIESVSEAALGLVDSARRRKTDKTDAAAAVAATPSASPRPEAALPAADGAAASDEGLGEEKADDPAAAALTKEGVGKGLKLGSAGVKAGGFHLLVTFFDHSHDHVDAAADDEGTIVEANLGAEAVLLRFLCYEPSTASMATYLLRKKVRYPSWLHSCVSCFLACMPCLGSMQMAEIFLQNKAEEQPALGLRHRSDRMQLAQAVAEALVVVRHPTKDIGVAGPKGPMRVAISLNGRAWVGASAPTLPLPEDEVAQPTGNYRSKAAAAEEEAAKRKEEELRAIRAAEKFSGGAGAAAVYNDAPGGSGEAEIEAPQRKGHKVFVTGAKLDGATAFAVATAAAVKDGKFAKVALRLSAVAAAEGSGDDSAPLPPLQQLPKPRRREAQWPSAVLPENVAFDFNVYIPSDTTNHTIAVSPEQFSTMLSLARRLWADEEAQGLEERSLERQRRGGSALTATEAAAAEAWKDVEAAALEDIDVDAVLTWPAALHKWLSSSSWSRDGVLRIVAKMFEAKAGEAGGATDAVIPSIPNLRQWQQLRQREEAQQLRGIAEEGIALGRRAAVAAAELSQPGAAARNRGSGVNSQRLAAAAELRRIADAGVALVNHRHSTWKSLCNAGVEAAGAVQGAVEADNEALTQHRAEVSAVAAAAAAKAHPLVSALLQLQPYMECLAARAAHYEALREEMAAKKAADEEAARLQDEAEEKEAEEKGTMELLRRQRKRRDIEERQRQEEEGYVDPYEVVEAEDDEFMQQLAQLQPIIPPDDLPVSWPGEVVYHRYELLRQHVAVPGVGKCLVQCHVTTAKAAAAMSLLQQWAAAEEGRELQEFPFAAVLSVTAVSHDGPFTRHFPLHLSEALPLELNLDLCREVALPVVWAAGAVPVAPEPEEEDEKEEREEGEEEDDAALGSGRSTEGTEPVDAAKEEEDAAAKQTATKEKGTPRSQGAEEGNEEEKEKEEEEEDTETAVQGPYTASALSAAVSAAILSTANAVLASLDLGEHWHLNAAAEASEAALVSPQFDFNWTSQAEREAAEAEAAAAAAAAEAAAQEAEGEGTEGSQSEGRGSGRSSIEQ